MRPIYINHNECARRWVRCCVTRYTLYIVRKSDLTHEEGKDNRADVQRSSHPYIDRPRTKNSPVLAIERRYEIYARWYRLISASSARNRSAVADIYIPRWNRCSASLHCPPSFVDLLYISFLLVSGASSQLHNVASTLSNVLWIFWNFHLKNYVGFLHAIGACWHLTACIFINFLQAWTCWGTSMIRVYVISVHWKLVDFYYSYTGWSTSSNIEVSNGKRVRKSTTL